MKKKILISFLILIIAFTAELTCGDRIKDLDLEIFRALPSLNGLPDILLENQSQHHFFVKFQNSDFKKHKIRLAASSLEVIEYIPQNTYLVRSKAAITSIRKINAPGIEIIEYLPLLKIEPALLKVIRGDEILPQDTMPLLIILFDDSDKSKVLDEIAMLDGVKIKDELYPDPARIVLLCPAAILDKILPAVSALEDVYRIEVFRDKVVSNYDASWIGQSGIFNERPVFDHGITGVGQIIAVSDTGLDVDHCFFYDQVKGIPASLGSFEDPQQRKVTAYFVWTGDNDWDAQGHGTHTSGSACGDNFLNIGGYDLDDGMAFGAKLIMQDLGWGDVLTLAGTPSNLEQLFSQAFNAGARIHSNSWGNESNVYSSHARDVDNFLYKNQDMVIVFANGNEGPGSGTVGEPATAKNCISVGASKKGIGDTGHGIASFSSRGNTSDGRLKPDLVAPGVYINSARNDRNLQSFNCERAASSGTSMSTPIVAGYTALVRQYFTDGFYPTGKVSTENAFTPSGALVKAAIINSCDKIPGDNSVPPNSRIGWGQPVLDNALFFEGDSRKLLVYDERDGIPNGQSKSYRFVNASSGIPLKLTLTWYDPRGSSSASKKLVNNLDLKLSSPVGDIYSGNNFSPDGNTVVGNASNDTDNIEGILINEPTPGLYEISINGVSIPSGSQSFALVVTGDLIGKASDICFDKKAYKCVDNIILRAADVDLAGAGSLHVKVSSEIAGDEITFTLVELQPGTGIFSALLTIGIDSTNNPDLIVKEMDTVKVSFIDADDGMGHQNVEVECSTSVDCISPVISDIKINDAGYDYITITWQTNEETKGEVVYSHSATLQETTFYEGAFSRIHAVRLDNLRTCSEYNVSITAADVSGNKTIDDNNGAFYRFNTLSQLLIHASGELTGEGRWKLSYSYSLNGGYAWSSGYGANQCNRLYTPYFFIPPDQPTFLTFWTIYDIESGFDGGIVQVASDYNDNWEIVEPLFTGYPMISRDDTTSCIGQSVPCFSGENREWQKYTIDLTPYAGKAASVSFLFGTDPASEGDGWFIDQIEIWRNLQCISIENNTNDAKIECQMSKNIYHRGDYIEGLLFYDNPKAEDIDVNVYCAIILNGSIFFFNGKKFVTNPEGFTKTLKGGSQTGESIFVFPILTDALKGNYTFAAALTRIDSFKLYGGIETYTFEIK